MAIGPLFYSGEVLLPGTFIAGAAIYILEKEYEFLMVIIGYSLALGIVVSFLFNVGEVHTYHFFYKRAFFFFGDGITTVLVLFFCYGVVTGKRLLGILAAGSVFMSGARISIVLLVLMIVFLSFMGKKEVRKTIFLSFSKYVLAGLLVYIVALFFSIIATSTKPELPRNPMIGHGGLPQQTDEKTKYGQTGESRNSVKSLSNLFDCVEAQIKNAFWNRYFSSMAGLWMTLKGGFHGPNYSSLEDYAELLVKSDPWGINEKYGLNRSDWKRIGAPKNPYLRFGSRYGPWLLLLISSGLLLIGYLGVRNIQSGESPIGLVFTGYFIINVVFNQVQPWLTPKSLILVALGFCAYHIIVVWLLRKYPLPAVFSPMNVPSEES